MSVETFEGIYPADREELRNILDRQKNRETSLGAKSPVVLLALNLVKEGGNGLRESSKKLISSDRTLRFTPGDLSRIPKGIRQEMRKNWAAIMSGVSIYSIDDTCCSKEFSYELVASLHNMMINGTPFSPLRVGEVKEQPIRDNKWKEMISLANGDKTLTSFFESRYIHLMPDGLRKLIDEMRILPVIRSDIIPIFKPRAKLLISS